MAVRVTQTAVESLVVGTPNVRATQVALEALVQPDLSLVDLRITHVALEVAYQQLGSLVGESTAVASATTSLVLSVPGNADNKVLIAQIAFRGGTGRTVTPPSGWNLVDRVDNGTDVGMVAYWRAAEDEPATYTWTFNGSTEAGGGISAYTGLRRGGPVEAVAEATADGTSIQTPDIETSTRSPRLVFLAAGNASSSTTAEWTPPTDFTETRDRSTSTGTTSDRITVFKADKGNAGGNTGLVNAAAVSGNKKVALILALRDASASGRVDSFFIQ